MTELLALARVDSAMFFGRVVSGSDRIRLSAVSIVDRDGVVVIDV